MAIRVRSIRNSIPIESHASPAGAALPAEDDLTPTALTSPVSKSGSRVLHPAESSRSSDTDDARQWVFSMRTESLCMNSQMGRFQIGRLLTLLLCSALGSAGTGRDLSAQPPAMPIAAVPTNQELLFRLKAAEAELRFLRERDTQCLDSEQDSMRRLPANPATFEFGGTPLEAPNLGKDACSGIGPLCSSCQDSLSWNKCP